MRRLAILLAVGLLGICTPAYGGPPTHSVPPPAPRPTGGGKPPAAPDPHAPAGGIDPYGELVGGSRLHSRGLVLPAHAKPLPPI